MKINTNEARLRLWSCIVSALLLLLAGTLPAPSIADATQSQSGLTVMDIMVGDVPLSVELANNGEQRYLGLSFRERLDENAGMLFVYAAERPLTFTMRDTLLPLSIAYIDSSLAIIEIIDMDVGPGQLFPSSRPARFALEVNQGWFERNGIKSGDKLSLPRAQ